MVRTPAPHERHLEAMLRMHEVGGELLLEPRPQELSVRVLERGLELLQADAICLATRDDKSAPMSVVQRGTGPLSDDVLADLLAAADPAQPKMFAHSDARVPHLGEDGFRAAIVAPVSARGSVLGHLVALWTALPVSEQDAERVAAFAFQVGVALHAARANAALARRVEELLRTRDDLVLAEKLRLSDELADGVALELAASLTTMRGALAIAQGAMTTAAASPTDPVDDSMRRALDDLRDGVRALGNLATALGRRPAPPEPSSRRPLRVASVVARCIEARATDRQLALAVEIPDELCALCSGGDLQAAVSLVIEALARIPVSDDAPRELRIRAFARERHVIVSVRDPALRLDANARARALDPRLHRGATPRLEHELPLAQQLARRNGGDLVLVDALDGTRFQLQLERTTHLELCKP